MKKTLAIIGGGPASLFLAAFLNSDLFDITIYEQNKSLGRKFLVAGKGGFNLTHSEPMETFIERYTPNNCLKEALLFFDNTHLRQWLNNIGIPTYIGSSKRIYPEDGIKPIEVLNAIVRFLDKKGINIQFEHHWTGWNDNMDLTFKTNDPVKADYTVFALGGGSWKVTGSDGNWLSTFAGKGINTLPFYPANCAYGVEWGKEFIAKNEGRPLKNIAIQCDGKIQKGEVVLTQFGLEGNAIYALSPQIQHTLTIKNEAIVYLDLKPTLDREKIETKLQLSKHKKTTDILRKDLKLSSAQVDLIKATLTKEEFLNTELLAQKMKGLPLKITSAAPLDEAISTTGGIDLKAVDANFELKELRHHFCIGEMLDWNAPTGGYLLQACFSMGAFLADKLNQRNTT
ncbi:MAG: NAD(P)-dependent oxidoreductase [Crocinitomicaceae bacterium]|nr:NAD(P)-dependent oxidoreductase [Crocinitomicaceae bacterium]